MHILCWLGMLKVTQKCCLWGKRRTYQRNLQRGDNVCYIYHAHNTLPCSTWPFPIRWGEASFIHSFQFIWRYSWSFGINKALWEITSKEKHCGYFFLLFFGKKERCSWFFLYHLKSLSHYVTWPSGESPLTFLRQWNLVHRPDQMLNRLSVSIFFKVFFFFLSQIYKQIFSLCLWYLINEPNLSSTN